MGRGDLERQDPDGLRAYGAAVPARQPHCRPDVAIRRHLDLPDRAGGRRVSVVDHGRRRSLQSDFSFHVALRLRPGGYDGGGHQASPGPGDTGSIAMKDIPSTRPRIDKLGVKTGYDVLLLGIEDDEGFVA